MGAYGAVAQADIKCYYDSLPFNRLIVWLCQNCFPPEVAATIVRHQLLSSMFIMLRGQTKELPLRDRAIGGVTGSRTAGQIARIPVEEAFRLFSRRWKDISFKGAVAAACWVDNVYSFGRSGFHAVELLKEIEMYLQEHWDLKFKPSSKLVLLPKDADQEQFDLDWPVVSVFPVLGHLISSSGTVRPCVRAAVSAAWRAFWANVMKPCNVFSRRKALLRRMNTFVMPVLRYRFPRWTFYKSIALEIDRVQRRMVSIVLSCKRAPHEEQNAFYRRRAKAATSAQIEQGRWSERWAGAVVSWAEHVERDTASMCFVAKLSHIMPPAELNMRRSLNNGRPCTRAASGFIIRRWWDGVSAAKEYLSV